MRSGVGDAGGRATAYILAALAALLAVSLGISLFGDVYRHQNGCQVVDGQLPAYDICQYIGLRVSARSWVLLGGFLVCFLGLCAVTLRGRRHKIA